METKTIEGIRELNKEVKDIVKQHTSSSPRIIALEDFKSDATYHNIPKKKIDEILFNGLHLEDNHLYPLNPNKKHKGKNYYCIHGHRDFIYIDYILISYFKKPPKIILFHISHLSSGSKEQRRYKEILKNLAFKKT